MAFSMHTYKYKGRCGMKSSFYTAVFLGTGIIIVPFVGQAASPASENRNVATTKPENIVVSRKLHKVLASGQIARIQAEQSISSVDRSYISKQVAGAGVLNLVQNMPGANVATSDAFGMSNQVTMSVRGLNQQEIGFLVDGTPQNDTNSGTIFPSQLVDAENLQSASLSQGSSAIDLSLIHISEPTRP